MNVTVQATQTEEDLDKYVSIEELLHDYYHFRKLAMPNAEDAFLFLTSEVGELADAIVNRKPGWVRNNPDKDRSIPDEIGDIMMMLSVTAQQLGYDPIQCMLDKWAKKGWKS